MCWYLCGDMLEGTRLLSGKCMWVNNRVLRVRDVCGDLLCRQLVSPGSSLQLKLQDCGMGVRDIRL